MVINKFFYFDRYFYTRFSNVTLTFFYNKEVIKYIMTDFSSTPSRFQSDIMRMLLCSMPWALPQPYQEGDPFFYFSHETRAGSYFYYLKEKNKHVFDMSSLFTSIKCMCN